MRTPVPPQTDADFNACLLTASTLKASSTTSKFQVPKFDNTIQVLKTQVQDHKFTIHNINIKINKDHNSQFSIHNSHLNLSLIHI